MRSSDWSSDLCSSDLARLYRPVDAARHRREKLDPARRFRDRGNGPWRRQDGGAARRRAQARDRKSVVQGKSGSLRVDLGGRRFIKNKTIRASRMERSFKILTISVVAKQQQTKQ